MEALNISRSGLDVEWQRLQVIAQNLANMNTTRTGTGEVYHPMRLVSGPDTSFGELLSRGAGTSGPAGVRVLGLEQIANGVTSTFDPTHPHANSDGFVRSTNVNHAGEMTLLIRTSRAYEANLTAISIAQQMYSRALEMGRGG